MVLHRTENSENRNGIKLYQTSLQYRHIEEKMQQILAKIL